MFAYVMQAFLVGQLAANHVVKTVSTATQSCVSSVVQARC